MTKLFGFECVRDTVIKELSSRARLWRHGVTGAQVLSVSNSDENKVFGVSFRTPPEDSTGVAHILEHSVLCGSEKYPVKEPFVELLKSSLQTFLNAFTYPDKTCYPVASANLQDFYNLIDVYLDAAFFPRITEAIFQQEGWHYELDAKDAPLTYKGVVFNEMKGVYSSPDSMLSEKSQQSLFPDITYGLDSGGNPAVIPDLTYEQFHAFHETYYHPANARFFFWGDDPEEERLAILSKLLDRFGPLDVDSAVPLQERFAEPVAVVESYPAGEGEERAMMTVNWLLPETRDVECNFAMQMLEHVLVGTPASPLRKALIESGLGEDLAGVGLENELRQMYFSTGLKGIDPQKADQVEALIFDTLQQLAEEGIDPAAIEAAINSVEFSLRENNSGRFPVGLAVMVHSLTTWLYDEDPLALLAFGAPLEEIKQHVADGPYFEDMIQALLLTNMHRSRVLLVPQADLADVRRSTEEGRLASAKEGMTGTDLDGVMENAASLHAMQEAPDAPEALDAIPRLTLQDIPRSNQRIPHGWESRANVDVMTHDLDTKGILYADLSFDMSVVPQHLLPLVPLYARCLTEMGTTQRDFVELGMRIAAKTGGIGAGAMVATELTGRAPVLRFSVSGKSTADKAGELFDLMREILLEGRLDNQERFRSIVLEERARSEQRLIPAGHQVVMGRLRSRFSVSAWLDEQMEGITGLQALDTLLQRVEGDWGAVEADLETLRSLIVRRNAVMLNTTLDAKSWDGASVHAETLLAALPERDAPAASWVQGTLPEHEAFVIPAQVNYVGKGANLYDLGYQFHGSANVVFKHLRMGWLWDKVRVQGGAYGAFSAFDRASGILCQVSYRDPNLLRTLEMFDGSAEYLRTIDLSPEALEKAIIGAIGDLDAYLLPDARGAASFARHVTGDTDEARQQMRDEMLSTTTAHFHAFADLLSEAARVGRISVLGGAGVRETAQDKGWEITDLL